MDQLLLNIASRIGQISRLHRKVGYEHLNKHLIVFIWLFEIWVGGIYWVTVAELVQVEGVSYWHTTLYYLVILRLKVRGDKGEDLLGIQPLHSVLRVKTKKTAMGQEPRHISTCTLSNENSQQRLYFPSFSPPLTYDLLQSTKFICKEVTVRVQGEEQHPLREMWEQGCSWMLQYG